MNYVKHNGKLRFQRDVARCLFHYDRLSSTELLDCYTVQYNSAYLVIIEFIKTNCTNFNVSPFPPF